LADLWKTSDSSFGALPQTLPRPPTRWASAFPQKSGLMWDGIWLYIPAP
jgi:hypothetical protein